MLLAKQKQVARLVAAIKSIELVQDPFEAAVRRVQPRSRAFLYRSHTARLGYDHYRVWVVTDGHWSSLSTIFGCLGSSSAILPLLEKHPSLVPQWREYQGAYDSLRSILCEILRDNQAYFWPIRSRGNSYLRHTDSVGVSLLAAAMAARRVLRGWSLQKACLNSRRIYAKYNRKGSHHRKR